MSREQRLPKWAREELGNLRASLDYERERFQRLELAHSLTSEGREWFTLASPGFQEAPMGLGLFFLSREGAHRLCTLYEGDVMVIGRKRK